MRRLDSGIAIGPLLMIIALIAVILGAMNMGMGGISGALSADRTAADLRGQIEMIRTKIGECIYLTRSSTDPQFEYPEDDNLDAEVPLTSIDCPRDPGANKNMWTGARPANLPAPPSGFSNWVYVNHGDPALVSPGGTCIYIQPSSSSTASSPQIREGIANALRKFSPSEYTYDSSSANQRIIIWIRRPASGTAC